MEFDIGVWLTDDLDSNGIGDPRQALSKFIPPNFQDAGHSVDLTIHSHSPVAPAESYSHPDHWPQTAYPCVNGSSFDDLLDWWESEHVCNSYTTHSDVNLLVTNYDSTAGATTGDCDEYGNHYCVAEASNIGDLEDEPTYSSGSELRYSQMYATVLHEIGHAVIDETGSYSCSGSPVNEERTGDSFTQNGNTYTTPMVTFDNGDDQNACCYDLEPDPGYWSRHYSRSFSFCVENHLVNCANKY